MERVISNMKILNNNKKVQELNDNKSNKSSVIEEEEDLEDEWKNEELRASLAKSSIVRIRQPSNTLLFGKGKVIKLKRIVIEK